MDRTIRYRVMCQKAIELQELRKQGLWEEGDFYTAYKHNRVFVWGGEGEDEPYDSSHPVWLLRQDQLQEIIKFKVKEMDKFVGYCICGMHRHDSMEQLWLVFVMKEKYNKIWNGENWIKEK